MGRGEGGKMEEGIGDTGSLGKRQGPNLRRQETCPSIGRARLEPSEFEEGTSFKSKEGLDKRIERGCVKNRGNS